MSMVSGTSTLTRYWRQALVDGLGVTVKLTVANKVVIDNGVKQEFYPEHIKGTRRGVYVKGTGPLSKLALGGLKAVSRVYQPSQAIQAFDALFTLARIASTTEALYPLGSIVRKYLPYRVYEDGRRVVRWGWQIEWSRAVVVTEGTVGVGADYIVYVPQKIYDIIMHNPRTKRNNARVGVERYGVAAAYFIGEVGRSSKPVFMFIGKL